MINPGAFMIFVTVMEPQGREIYINGVYDESVGQAALTIMLEEGAHVFEAVISVGADRFVDFAESVNHMPDGQKATIDLQPVIPRRLIV